MIIGIDPGHGGTNSGCQYDAILEKAYTLETGLALRKALAALGMDSDISRNGDETVSMEQRAARLAHCDFVLVLHVNAAVPADAPKAKSLHTYFNADQVAGSQDGKVSKNSQMGKIILEAAMEIELCAPQLVRPPKPRPLEAAKDGPEARAYNCLTHHRPPAILVEMFFATHPVSNRWATTPYGRASLVATLAAGCACAWYHTEIQHPIDAGERKLV